MNRTGYAYLPLHGGYVPRWLFKRMIGLGEKIVYIIINDFGSDELLRRLSDPVWFQALGCVLGFDYHSSGLTTVVTSALKEACTRLNLGLFIAGGKGIYARRTIDEIRNYSRRIDRLDGDRLGYTSKIVAKVDNALLLDGYHLYHHTLFFDENNNWTIVQQGMNPNIRYARRYHWTSFGLRSYVTEPHTGMIGNESQVEVVDLTSRESGDNVKVMLDLVKERDRIKKDLMNIRYYSGEGLVRWIDASPKASIKLLRMPKRINWDAVRKAYELQPTDLEEFINISGIGPSTVRAISLISEVIYGAEPSKKDPIRYTFAVGGKDGVPFPIDRKLYDDVISYFDELADKAKLDRRKVLNRLSGLLSHIQPIK